jgi:hypothetical protein
MTKYLFFGLFLVLVAYFARQAHDGKRRSSPLQVPGLSALPVGIGSDPATPPQDKTQDCRDTCEQRAVVEGQDDDQKRDCQARCEAASPQTTPYQPIRRVTRAPADHRRTAPAKW